MQGALTEEQVEEMPREAPVVATNGTPNTAQRSIHRELAKNEHGSRDKGVERDEANEPAYEPTFIEEELWPGDLSPMWPAYMPGV